VPPKAGFDADQEISGPRFCGFRGVKVKVSGRRPDSEMKVPEMGRTVGRARK